VTASGLTHGVLYDIAYDDRSTTDGVVRIKNVPDGNIYKMGFPEGDFSSG
jgi:hypothetical protein